MKGTFFFCTLFWVLTRIPLRKRGSPKTEQASHGTITTSDPMFIVVVSLGGLPDAIVRNQPSSYPKVSQQPPSSWTKVPVVEARLPVTSTAYRRSNHQSSCWVNVQVDCTRFPVTSTAYHKAASTSHPKVDHHPKIRINSKKPKPARMYLKWRHNKLL